MLHLARRDELRTIERTVLDGIAKPTPSEPPDSLSICALTPMTRPRRSSSGPPELPWLIAASVWIVSVIVKLFGAVIWRWSALTIPLVTVPSSPNGLPSASTGSPTSTALESPEPADRGAPAARRPGGRRDRSRDRCPTSAASSSTPFQKLTEIEDAPATTCWFVTMWPSRRRRTRSPARATEPRRRRRSRRPPSSAGRRSRSPRDRPTATGSEPSTVTWRTTVVEPSSRTANAAAPRPTPRTRAATSPATSAACESASWPSFPVWRKPRLSTH